MLNQNYSNCLGLCIALFWVILKPERFISFCNKFSGMKLVGFRETFHQLLSFLLTLPSPSPKWFGKKLICPSATFAWGVQLTLDITTEHLHNFSGVIILYIHLPRNKVKLKYDNSLFKMKLNGNSSVYSFFSSEATRGLIDDSWCAPQTIHFLFSSYY